MAKVEIQVLAYHLNVRKTASSSSTITKVVHKGEKYISSSQKSGWYYLDTKKGWAYGGGGKYVKVLRSISAKPPAKPPKPKPKPKTKQSPPIDYGKIKNIIDEGNVNSEVFDKLNQTGGSVITGDDAIQLQTIQNDYNFPVVETAGNITMVNYEIGYDAISTNMKAIRENMNILGDAGFKSIRENLFTRFNRFKTAFPDYHLTKSFSHVFFTRPDCHLTTKDAKGVHMIDQELTNDPLYYYLYNNNPKILESLTQRMTSSHQFLPYLSNAATSFELSDEYIKTIEHGETFTGYKLQYGKNNIESNTAGSFSVNYTDDNDYTIYKIHKAWMEYISKVYRGEITPHREYVQRRILDYASSVYYFVVGQDGETILFWSKYFGIFPTNAPSAASSWSRGSAVKLPEFAINYSYSFKEDFSPLSLAEFNMNSSKATEYKKTYEKSLNATGRTMSGTPFIETTKDPRGQYIYKLRFAK